MVAFTARLAYACLLSHHVTLPFLPSSCHAVKMRPLLLCWVTLGCVSAILSSSTSIHLLWLPNRQQTLQFNPRHLFFPSRKFDSVLLPLSFSSCLTERPAVHGDLACRHSASFFYLHYFQKKGRGVACFLRSWEVCSCWHSEQSTMEVKLLTSRKKSQMGFQRFG